MKNNKNILLLLTPSWVTNFIGVALGVLVTAGVIVLSRFQGSELRRQIFEVQANAAPETASSAYENITTNIANNVFLSGAPLLITWACVGLVVYYFAISIARSLGQAVDLRDQLEYVNVSRQVLLRQAIISLAVRALAVIGWFGFIKLSLNVFIPYALAAANVASQSFSLSSIGYALLAVVIIYVNVCIHVIFLRLIVLKPRLFSR